VHCCGLKKRGKTGGYQTKTEFLGKIENLGRGSPPCGVFFVRCKAKIKIKKK
jgi:hypothetical protein